MKRLYLLIGAIVGVGFLMVVAMGGGGLLAPAPDLSPSLVPSPQLSPFEGEGGRRPGEGEGQIGLEQIGPELGQLAPDFALTDMSKGEVTSPLLSDLRGHVVLLNFWVSTCAYCRKEMPMLQKLSEKYPEIVVIGVNVLEDKDTIETFLWEVGVSYRVAQDGWGEVSSAYQVMKIPATFLIDERGVIVWREFGAVGEAELEEQVQGLKER